MTTPAYVIQCSNLEFRPSAEAVEVALNRGVVIDVNRRGSLLGLEVGTVAGRTVVTSLDTDPRRAGAGQRLDSLAETRAIPKRSSRR